MAEEPDVLLTSLNSRIKARLSFWVPPERREEFELAYEKQVVPILRNHGLVDSLEDEGPVIDSVFSRLFLLQTCFEVATKQKALQEDPELNATLYKLMADLGIAQSDPLVPVDFKLHSAPAGPGRVAVAGQGTGHWRTYDMTDGLAGVSVTSTFQDEEGYLWFGTYGGGVSRYDGNGFTNLTTRDGLAGNWVWSICQDRDRRLWFGTDRGVSRYDGNGFSNLTTEDGLASNAVWSVFQDAEGCFWFGTSMGVSRYDGRTFTTFIVQDGLAHEEVRVICQDREGRLWFGTMGGVSRYDAKGMTSLTAANGLGHNDVRTIFQDREGVLWFGTVSGVSRYDGCTFTTCRVGNVLAYHRVRVVIQDREGDIWLATEGGGVSRYHPHGHSASGGTGETSIAITEFCIEDGLASNYVQSMLQDREGHFWFGTVGGVSRYDGQTFTTFTVQDGLAHNDVRAIFQDREGVLWVGTSGGGISRYDGRTFTTFTVQDGLAHSEVRAIFQDREGFLWFGTVSGVSRYDGRTFTTFTVQDGLAHSEVRAIFQDRGGYLWFSTFGCGASRYDGASFTTFNAETGLAHNRVRTIFQDREGVLWFGTWGGLSRYDGKTFRTFTTREGLAHNDVGAIFQDREGFLWFGTSGGGVSRYDPSAGLEEGGKGFANFTVEDGLACNFVLSIYQDRNGRLWFGTFGGGASQYDGRVFQRLTQHDGMAGNVVYSILQDREGYFWFGIVGGVTRYLPPVSSPPVAFIDEVVADRRYEQVPSLTIPSSARLTAFEFHGMSLKTRPEAIVYQYRLKGWEEGWKTTRERCVEYQDLPPGEYLFQVKAVDRDLSYSEPATVHLTVEPDLRIQALTEALSGEGMAGKLVGSSEALRRMEVELAQVAKTDVTVLILGETGTGKGLAARAVHALSARWRGPFIQVNCGAIPDGLVESELFGHERGAFTGAISRKLGKVELAEGGTLFLDEIGNLTPEAQGKLLMLLEERILERLGGTETRKVDVRVIVATNRDLRQMVAEGRFREDLYFRLQAFPVRMPPLRERKEDIPLLAAFFMARMASSLNKEVTHIVPEAMSLLKACEWPGNVRELEHAIQRAVIVSPGGAIRAEDIVLEFVRAGLDEKKEIVTLRELEKRYIQEVLEKTGWVIKGPQGAAVLLGLKESTLRSRMQKLGIARL